MIGYFNAKKQSEDKYLLTNDMGFYKYVNSETYDKLCNNKIDKEDEDYEDLIEKGFIVNISIEEYIKKQLQEDIATDQIIIKIYP